LTPSQVSDAVRQLQPLKTPARDLLPNRARLERAHRLYVELLGLERADLDARIDAFEAALESGDAERIKMAAAILDDVLGVRYRDEGEGQRVGRDVAGGGDCPTTGTPSGPPAASP
jgi:molecular chaperone HscC